MPSEVTKFKVLQSYRSALQSYSLKGKQRLGTRPMSHLVRDHKHASKVQSFIYSATPRPRTHSLHWSIAGNSTKSVTVKIVAEKKRFDFDFKKIRMATSSNQRIRNDELTQKTVVHVPSVSDSCHLYCSPRAGIDRTSREVYRRPRAGAPSLTWYSETNHYFKVKEDKLSHRHTRNKHTGDLLCTS